MNASKAKWLMASVSLAWGSSYLFMKLALTSLEPFNLIALRFGIAFMALSMIFFKRYRQVTRTVIFQGMLMGTILFLIFAFLVLAVKYTNASTAGFLTGSTVVMVPIIESLVYHRLPPFGLVISILIVFGGLFLLSATSGISLDLGALYGLIGALGYAIHILVFDKIAKQGDPFMVSVIQLGFASLVGAGAMVLFETPALPQTPSQWVGILILGLVCSGYGFVVQPIAQQHADPATIGIIFALEPVFSALLSFVFLGELLSGRGYLGAVLIFVGVILANLVKTRIKPARQLEP